MLRLRKDRKLTPLGTRGLDIYLPDYRLTDSVFWSSHYNSYAAYELAPGRVCLASINGIGELRWSGPPEDPGCALSDRDWATAVDYFFEEA